MPHGTHIVIITNWWPLTAHERRPPSPSKRQSCSRGPLHITALVYYGRNGGFISIKTAEKLTGTKEGDASNFPSFVGISWTFDGSNQDLETSQVQVVPGLKQDLVLGRKIDELYQSVPSALPNPQSNQPETVVVDEPLAFNYKTREYIESLGIIPANQESLEAFTSLLDRYRPKDLASSHDDRATSDLEDLNDPMEASVETLHSSTFDEASNVDSDGDLATTCDGSEHGFMVSLPEPSYVNSLTDSSEHDSWEIPSQLSGTASSGSQPGTPAQGWSLVGENTVITQRQCVLQATEEHMINGSQLSDFEADPGHRFWTWDTQSERWRRRGRSGLEERDWFTDTFSQ